MVTEASDPDDPIMGGERWAGRPTRVEHVGEEVVEEMVKVMYCWPPGAGSWR